MRFLTSISFSSLRNTQGFSSTVYPSPLLSFHTKHYLRKFTRSSVHVSHRIVVVAEKYLPSIPFPVPTNPAIAVSAPFSASYEINNNNRSCLQSSISTRVRNESAMISQYEFQPKDSHSEPTFAFNNSYPSPRLSRRPAVVF
ncbi:hypothetical protein VTL71DRAFT_4905 [Oculimacula yallundae]|uniref:Uncharacterized protein n=1 Tax=Oculimacula yallundae TaxID=86028 RepID=A0ABR4C4Z8_9HELO